VERVKQNLEEKSTNIEKILKRRVKPEEVISALKIGFEKVFTCRMEEIFLSQISAKVSRSQKLCFFCSFS